MHLKQLVVAALICSALGAFPCRPAQAGTGGGEYDTIETSSAQELVDGMATKAGRGLANITCGWLELPKQIYVTTHEEGVAKGVLLGPLKGVGMAIIRTASGAVELATFLVAYPGFYAPYFDPAYVWQKE